MLCGPITVTLRKGNESSRPGDVMLAVIRVHMGKGVFTNALLDPGSNSTLCTHSLAKKLGLSGRKVTQSVELAGKHPELQQVAYYRHELPSPGGPIPLTMVGMDIITSNRGSFSLAKAYELFPHKEPGVLDRPEGPVELLIGADRVQLLPFGGVIENLVGNLRVYDIILPPYKVLVGYHPEIDHLSPPLSAVAAVGIKGGVSSHYREALDMKRWADDSMDTVEESTLKGNHVEVGKGAKTTTSGRGAPLPQTEA